MPFTVNDRITPIPDAFIDDYLPVVKNPMFVLIYIFAFRYYSVGIELTVKETAAKLEILESDVINAWKYWEDKGLILIHDLSYENFIIEFLPVESKREGKKREKINQGIKRDSNNDEPKKEEPVNVTVEFRPSYNAKEMERKKEEDKQVHYLFSIAERMLSKPLTYIEMNALLGFYDWLKLPVDVIEYMLDYCISNNHRGIRYLEKVAIDWADNSVGTVEEAEEYIKMFDRDYRDIMKSFGLNSRDPNPKEMAYMKKWLKEYQMPLDIIKEACNKTIFQIGQPRFTYADAILSSWNEGNVRTLEDISGLDDAYYNDIEEKKKALNAKTSVNKKGFSPSQKPPKNKFNNYEGRTWDYEKLLELEQIHIQQSIKKD